MPKPIDFPTHHHWITQHTHTFRPRNIGRTHDLEFIAATFLRSDKQFLHLLRQCKTQWYVTVILGTDSVHLDIYDGEYVAKSGRPVLSFHENLVHRVMFSVDKESNLSAIRDPKSKRHVLSAGAMLYSHRRLSSAEMRTFDSLYANMLGVSPTRRPSQPETAPLSEDILRPDFTLE